MKKVSIGLIPLLITLLWQSAVCQVEQRSPSEKNPKAVQLIKQAMLLEEAGKLEEAINKYKEVLRLEPKDFAAMNTIAGLYGKLEMPAEEVIWAKKAIDTNPKYFQAHVNYGNGLAMQGKFDVADLAYQEAAKLAPKSPLPIYSQGVVAENQNRFQEALTLYKKSVELDPRFEDGLFSAAAMHATLKQFTEAKALLTKLLEINPKADDARQILSQIEREKP